uniref:VWFA domain-containing protein n=1 Tax=Panagrolaimus sp. JU765 TaxID=591449 RepID=A0AC34Q4D1_9BILA
AFRPTVDTVLIIISDHPPIGLDTNNKPSTAVVTQMAVDLANTGIYIGAITPVGNCSYFSLTSDCFSTVLTHYGNIVSNLNLLANGITSYDSFGDNVQSYLLRTVCGYVSGPSVPTSVVPPTAASPPVSLLTTPNVPGTTVGPGGDPLKCLPVNIMFVLDNSQSINNVTYNDAVRAFVTKISLAYGFAADPGVAVSSQIGVVQFASNATITFPLKPRTREEFILTINQSIYYIDQGITNISLGLDTALAELQRQGLKENVMVILMTDGVSTLDIAQTQDSANRVKAYTKFFAGVGIDGINGNDISANISNLQTLIGNKDLAYPDIPTAEGPKGIWYETRIIYPCPVPACKGVIFIGEMTEVIAQYRKGVFLNATKSIAAYLNANPGGTEADQLLFAIGTYGNQTFRPPKLQTFIDFNNDLDQLINDVAANNQPNAGQTKTSSILEDLYTVLTSGTLNNYLVLFMGETERILDIQLTEASVARVASTGAQVFVLDMTNGFWTNDYLFQHLVNNNLSKIYNYSGQSAADLNAYYTTASNQFAQIWNGMTCTAPPDPVCNAFFDMFLVVRRTVDMSRLKVIAKILNAQYTAVSNYAGFTKRGLIVYGNANGIVDSNDLTFDSNAISNAIQNLLGGGGNNNYVDGYNAAVRLLRPPSTSYRTYGQNIIVIISDQYPVSTDQQCTDLKIALANWNKDQKTPVVYYITTSDLPQGQQRCSAFTDVKTVPIEKNPILDNPTMAPIIKEICTTPLPPLMCPCSGSNVAQPPRNFLQRYYG